MKNKIYCLLVSGINLSEAACDALFQAACDCVRDEINDKKVYNDDVAGEIRTDFDFAMIGTIDGIIFEADIETIKGKSKARYIVQTHDLEESRNKCVWSKLDTRKFNSDLN